MGQDRKVRIALGQMKVVQGDTKENLRKMMEMIDQAAEQNVDCRLRRIGTYSGKNV